MPVNIHGKQYITVDERVREAGKDFIGLNTEVLQHAPVVVIKATVTTTKGTFTGISYANVDKTIEKTSPYEVAETSAVGRALGFAGYGIVEGIASADEMVKASNDVDNLSKPHKDDHLDYLKEHFCEIHQREMKERQAPNGGHYYDHRLQIDGVWNMCSGEGWKPQSNSKQPYEVPVIPERQVNEDIVDF